MNELINKYTGEFIFFRLFSEIHYYLFYIVLIILILNLFNTLKGIILNKKFNFFDLRISLFGLIFSNIYFLIYVVLYIISPKFNYWSKLGFGVFSEIKARSLLVIQPLIIIMFIFFIFHLLRY